MHTCLNCAYQPLQDDWRFCPACGHALAPAQAAYLEFIGGPEDGRHAALTRVEMTIGRRSAHPITITTDRTISRDHARLIFQDGCFWIEDQASKLGTYVDEVRIEPKTAHRLNDGDVIRLGHTGMAFCLDASDNL